ncbi:MAG: hypothetical protein AMXMBFR66_11870 [Pseudomonadota bacterium]
MNQQTLALEPGASHPADRIGFELGWDHARHGLAPPSVWPHSASAASQGWHAARAVLGRRAAAAPRALRQWLELRALAWRSGIAFDAQQLTALQLAQIEVARCPILRRRLGGAAGQDTAPRFVRLDPRIGCALGNLVQVCTAAARACERVDLAEALRRARHAQRSGEAVHGLDAAAWWRLAVLRSFALRLPFFEAAGLPLAVLPPPRVATANPVQTLQWQLTLQFTAEGWSARLRALADLLPEQALREDFNLFVGALLPRVLDAARLPCDPHQALGDAWLTERVQRRWQQFALALGEAGCAALLARAQPAPGRPACCRGGASGDQAPVTGSLLPPIPAAGSRLTVPQYGCRSTRSCRELDGNAGAVPAAGSRGPCQGTRGAQRLP